MKLLTSMALVAAALCLILGIYSRVICIPLPFLPGGIEAQALLALTNTFLLVAIISMLQGNQKDK